MKNRHKKNVQSSCVQINKLQVSQYLRILKFNYIIPCWWYTYPSEKYDFVSWDDDIPKIWKVIELHGFSHHQPIYRSIKSILRYIKSH